jgi:hypothetical protein
MTTFATFPMEELKDKIAPILTSGLVELASVPIVLIK